MNCAECGHPVPSALAAIAVFVAGDEYIYSYFFCERCDVYTVEGYHDRFMGDDEAFMLPPISKDEGDRAVELIRACPDPLNKLCDCPSHAALYTGRVGP